jgi:hypothetical protein
VSLVSSNASSVESVTAVQSFGGISDNHRRCLEVTWCDHWAFLSRPIFGSEVGIWWRPHMTIQEPTSYRKHHMSLDEARPILSLESLTRRPR